MTVGAYDAKDNSIYLRSGRGFTASGLIKPDFVAPGVEVYGAAPGGMFVTRSGTSAATAVASGGVALMLEWSIVQGHYSTITGIAIKNSLIQSADRDAQRTYPDKSFGWGRLDVYQTFADFRIQ